MLPRLPELSLHRAIFRLAGPAVASMMLVNAFNLVDAFWVGRLGTDALGGMTASAFLVWCLHAAGQLVSTGLVAVVARRVGEGRPEEAGRWAAHGLLLAGLLAVCVIALGLPLQRPILRGMGLEPAVLEAAVAYLTPVLLGFPAITTWFAVDAVFRGSGDTRTPLGVMAVTLPLNAALDPLFIFGGGPVPALGIAGAAWATVLSHCVGVTLGLVMLQGRAVRPRGLRPVSTGLLGTLVRVGSPVAVTSLLFSVIYLLLTPVIARHGSAAVAAMGVGHRIEGLAYFTCLGFSAAAATLVGQFLGSGRPGLAERAAWLSTWTTAGILAALSVLFFAGAARIMGLFSDDARVVAEGAGYLRIVAVFETGMALELVLEGAFSGAGSTLPPMLIGVPLTALRVPVAHFLDRRVGLGVRGVWWAISGSTALKGIVTALWFRRNGWKKTRV